MPLREHIAELRRRFVKAGLAVIVASIGGWFLFTPVFAALEHPLNVARAATGKQIAVNLSDLTAGFNLQLKLAIYIGLVIASPVWLYQLWAFVLPGLTRNEKRYALGFSFAGVILFLGGITLAWLVLPNAVAFFTQFVPKGAVAFTSSDSYFSFVTRLMLSFGFAFVVPLVLVGMNMLGMVSALQLAKGWRVAVFLCFLGAAMASPTAEVSMMFLLALPMVALYMVAVGVAWYVDRRRARQAQILADDEASLIEAPEAIERPESL